MSTQFTRLNVGWNAEPNVPRPLITINGCDLHLFFRRNYMMYPDVPEDATMKITFRNCSKFRLGQTNDEGWHKGQCRFSKLAPDWGEFYEIQGDLHDNRIDESDWIRIRPAIRESRYLFYFRDHTFECDAESFELIF